MRPSGETRPGRRERRRRAGAARRCRRAAGRSAPRRAGPTPRSIVVGSSVSGIARRGAGRAWPPRERRASERAAGQRRQRRARTARIRERRFIGDRGQNSIPSRGDRRLRHRNRGSSTGTRSTTRRRPTSRKNARTDEEREQLPEMLSLWPFTGKIIVVAMLNPDSRHADASGTRRPTGASRRRPRTGSSSSSATPSRCSSPSSGRRCARFQRFVTFNGRGFDGPFLMLRSAALGIAVDAEPRRLPLRPAAAHRPARGRSRSSARPASGTSTSPARPSASRARRSTAWTAFPSAPTTGPGASARSPLYCRRDVEATAGLYQKLEKTLLPACSGNPLNPDLGKRYASDVREPKN